MQITVHAPVSGMQIGFRDSVMGRIARTLARFSNRISRVSVFLKDENGPRGGVDQHCRVRVLMPGIGEIASGATEDNPWAAVAQATRRARRKVMKKLKRPRSRRERYRKSRQYNPPVCDAPALVDESSP